MKLSFGLVLFSLLLAGCASGGDASTVLPGDSTAASIQLQSSVASAPIPPSYTIVDLGAGVVPLGINDSNEVVGEAAHQSGFLYQYGTMTKLGHLPGDVGSVAAAINNEGAIIGTSLGGGPDYHLHAALFYKDGRVVSLGTGRGTDSTGVALNNKGVLVGTVLYPGDACFGDAVIFDGKGGSRAIASGGAASRAVSDDGTILYDIFYSDGGPCRGQIMPYEYPSNTPVLVPSGGTQDNTTDVTGINSFGNIVGYFEDANSYFAGFFDSGDTSKELKYGLALIAEGINNRNWIVGSVRLTDGPHAFIYDCGRYTLLKSLARSSAGWNLQSARAINSSGAIAGTGTLNAAAHGFLLLPSGDGLTANGGSIEAVSR